MVRGNGSPSPEAKDTLRALRRAAKRALELGLQTGTPVYVWKDGKIVDLSPKSNLTPKNRCRSAP